MKDLAIEIIGLCLLCLWLGPLLILRNPKNSCGNTSRSLRPARLPHPDWLLLPVLLRLPHPDRLLLLVLLQLRPPRPTSTPRPTPTPPFSYWFSEGTDDLDEGRYRAAIGNFDEAIRLNPDSGPILQQ